MNPTRALVLTAAPNSGALEPSTVDRVIPAIGPARILHAAWLADSEAWHAVLTNVSCLDGPNLRQLCIDAAGKPGLDVNLIDGRPETQRKKLLVADMESTVIEQELIDELAEHVGLRDQISSITARAMRGELEFEAALRERVAMLAGLDVRVLDEVYDKRVTLMPGAVTLVKTMRTNGAYSALVSGGFTVFAERVARHLGFDTCQANVLEAENGRLTGRVKEPILGRTAKRAALERIARERGLGLDETLAAGDGANDLDMLASAGLGVAFRAKPKVREAALGLENGAIITYSDLTALLYLQGYRRNEFIF